MKKTIYLLWWITILLGIGISLFYFSQKQSSRVCCSEQCFTIELAITPAERQQGLMYRESLPKTAGMLFIFEQEEYHDFRMKNTLIPLDMIRINAEMEIIDIQEAIPCKADLCTSYSPEKASTYVLEINQWISKQQGIKIWDTCTLYQ